MWVGGVFGWVCVGVGGVWGVDSLLGFVGFWVAGVVVAERGGIFGGVHATNAEFPVILPK